MEWMRWDLLLLGALALLGWALLLWRARAADGPPEPGSWADLEIASLRDEVRQLTHERARAAHDLARSVADCDDASAECRALRIELREAEARRDAATRAAELLQRSAELRRHQAAPRPVVFPPLSPRYEHPRFVEERF